MVYQTKKGLVSRICDLREEFFNLLLGHVFRDICLTFYIMKSVLIAVVQQKLKHYGQKNDLYAPSLHVMPCCGN